MSRSTCPAGHSGKLVFLGNESERGLSWYKCLTCPLTMQVFSQILPVLPRFGFEARE